MKRFAYVFSIVFILFVNLKGDSSLGGLSPISSRKSPFLFCTNNDLPIAVEHTLTEFYEEFVDYAECNDVKLSLLLEGVNSIVTYPLEDELYGLYSPANRQIVINEYYLYSDIIVRKTLFHEIGHVFGLDHAESGVMATYQTPVDIYVSYFTGEKYDPSIWELHKAQMVSDIKKSFGYIISR